jgi:hypothetical protein
MSTLPIRPARQQAQPAQPAAQQPAPSPILENIEQFLQHTLRVFANLDAKVTILEQEYAAADRASAAATIGLYDFQFARLTVDSMGPGAEPAPTARQQKIRGRTLRNAQEKCMRKCDEKYRELKVAREQWMEAQKVLQGCRILREEKEERVAREKAAAEKAEAEKEGEVEVIGQAL